MRTFSPIWLAAIVALFTYGAAMAQSQGFAPLDQYELGPGDRVRIIVFGEADLSGEFELDSTGVVALPLIGQINANGIHARTLESRVEEALRQGYLLNPQVSAEVIAYRPFYILGEVEQPGKYPYVTGMTIVKAVALAGGYTARANRRRVFVQSNGEGQEVEKPADENVRVSPGDVLRVPESFF